MRKDHGWYPSFLDPKDVAPRDAPSEWLFKQGAKTACGMPGRCIEVKVGDEVPFDYWEAAGTAIVGVDLDGVPMMIQGEEPDQYDSVWNPRDVDAREFSRLANFKKSWGAKRGDDTTVGVEFIKWRRGVPFRIASGPKAIEVTA